MMTVIKSVSKWNEDKTCLTVSYDQEIKLKNKVAKKWLNKGWAITPGEASWLYHRMEKSMQEPMFIEVTQEE